MTNADPEDLAKPNTGADDESTPLLPISRPPSAPPQSSELLGYFYMALSCLGFSAMSFCVHVAESRFAFPSHSAIFVRSVVHITLSALYMLYYLPVQQTLTSMSTTQRNLLIFRGISGAVGMLLYFTALQILPVGDAVTAFFSGPVMVMILSHFFLSEPITPTDIVAAVTSFIGIALMSRPDLRASVTLSPHARIIGILCAIGGAFFASVAYVSIRSMGTRVHFMLSVFALACGTCFISILVGGAIGPTKFIAMKEGALLIALASITAFMGQCYLTKGLQLCRAGPGVLIRNLDVPIAYILGIVFLSESPTLLGLFGSTLVLASAIMIGARQMVRS